MGHLGILNQLQISLVERRQGPCKGIAWRRFKPRLWSAAKQAFSWAMLRSLVSFIRSRGWDTMGYSKFSGTMEVDDQSCKMFSGYAILINSVDGNALN